MNDDKMPSNTDQNAATRSEFPPAAQRALAEASKRELEKRGIFKGPIVTEIRWAEPFYAAEAYHQDYEKRNPDHPYIQRVSIPRLNRLKQYLPDLVKAEDSH